MNVGIVTYHFVRSYGAVWQATGLCQALRRLGATPTIIDYRPLAQKRYYRAMCWNSPTAPLRLLKEWTFQRYVRRELPVGSPEFNDFDSIRRADFSAYDAIICGSDQIWHREEHGGIDPTYFLGFTDDPAIRKIAYAASCGSTADYSADERARFGPLLRAFHAIGVRDQNTESMVSAVSGRPATRVLDPTLIGDMPALCRKTGWEGRDYVVVYSPLRTVADAAIAVGKAWNMPVVSLQHPHRGVQRNHPFIDPGTCLGYIRHARAVLTSYFHGTLLSIVFRRNFRTISDGARHLKITSVLQDLGLMDAYHKSAADARDSLLARQELPYVAAEPLLAGRIRASQEFLTAALTSGQGD